MFPGAGAQVYYNEAGEPLGWDYPDDGGAPYCDVCGYCHASVQCPDDESDE